MLKKRKREPISVAVILKDIVLDWCYLLTTTFTICVVLYFVHLLLSGIDLFGWIEECAKLIEANFWTSLTLLCLMASLFYNYLARKNNYDSIYYQDN